MEDYMLRELAEKYGTPLYLFDGDKIEETYRMMKDSFSNKIDLFYSVKANPTLAVCQILQKNGCGIEVASKGELRLALEAGFLPDKMLFSGPGKLESEIEFALEQEICAVIAESFQEIELISRLAEKRGKIVNIGVRINPSYESVQKNPVLSMMGRGTQFGVDKNELEKILPYIQKQKYLNLMCFHIYSGSQIFDYHVAASYLREAVQMVLDVIHTYNLDISLLDFGGGFGVSYDGKKEDFDFPSFAAEVEQLIGENPELTAGRKIAFESGRFLTARAGFFLTQVQYRKEINGSTFLIMDAGMNQNALATFREKRIRTNFSMHIISNQNPEETVSVAGPLCTPDDVLGRNVSINRSDRGDILCIPNSGAYGISFSPFEFLGHPRPEEVLVYHGTEYVARERGHFSDILNQQRGIYISKGLD